MTENPTQQLADFVVAAQMDDLPESSRERAKIVLIDTIASALMGIGDPEVSRIEKLALSVAPTGDSPVIAGKPLGKGAAILLNGYMINAATVCDVHQPTMCHTTPAAFPPSLAIGVERAVSGADFLLAFTLGVEIAIRVGIGSNYPAFRANGWHSPGVWGPFGSAAASGKLLGLDSYRMRNAFGLAGSQSAGTFAAWGSPTVKFHQSRGSLSGYLAANLAEAGFQSSVNVLTAEDGGLYRACSDGGRPELALDGLGEKWEFENLSLSIHPFATTLAAAAIALIDLADGAGASPADVKRVTMSLGWRAFGMHSDMQWGDPFHARLSAPYVAAVAVADRECGPDQFSVDRIADADLARYARENVEIVRDDSLGESGTAVELELSDGQVLRAAGVAPPGGPDSPLTLEDVKEKFLAAAERAQLDGWAPTALARLERIEEVPQIDADLVGSLP
jgi:2-methylcitrate dehydratase PrpD